MSTGARSNRRPTADGALHLTPCEFEIMEVVWQSGSATVRDVHKALKPARGLAYTTVMTVMDKLHRKGALKQQRQGRAYLYSAEISHAEALQQRVEHLIKYYFQGSRERFLEYLREGFDLRGGSAENRAEFLADRSTDQEIDTALL